MLCDLGHIGRSKCRKLASFQRLFMCMGVSVNVITAVTGMPR